MSERTTVRGRPTAQYSYVGIRDSLPTASADFKDQLTIVRGGAGVADKLYVCRKTAAGGYEWVELTDTAVPVHTHTSFQNFEVNDSRNAVASGGLTITSTTGQTVLSDTMTLSNGVTYDIYVWGHAQLSAGVGGTIEARIGLSGTGVAAEVNPWLGTGTEGGERGALLYAVDRAVSGSGQVVTVILEARRATANGTVGTASFLGQAIARGTGGVA